MKSIDINCDMGESFWTKKIGQDTEIMPYISSANIACGFHGGDPITISKTISNALKYNVSIGAHPSFWDLDGFGREEINMSKNDLKDILFYQISAVKGMVEAQGGKLNHVKPHGALYNMAAKSEEYSEAIVEVISQIDTGLKLFGLPNSITVKKANESKISFIAEAFSDRSYNDDGTLVSRKQSGATLEDVDLIVNRISRLVDTGLIQTINNEDLALDISTVCIHGDGPQALNIAKSIHKRLIGEGIEIKAP
ncbi:MAG: 5-oxoprolinase subunit PxpA [bacterium]|nr:5-oxoprolinase subunit PxpA [bacterium]